MSDAKTSNTVCDEDIERFRQTASEWWHDRGPYRLLHELNPVRIRYIQEAVEQHKQPTHICSAPLKILDIGCGGGLLCIPFARQGYHVTGIDACSDNILAARAYAQDQKLTLSYHAMDAATFRCCEPDASFDAVLLMEILEHIPQPDELIKIAVSFLKPGGLLFFSTLNRSWLSRFLAIGIAESLLGIPRGTHQWKKFLRPSEVLNALKECHIDPLDLTGVVYHPLHRRWSVDPTRLKINYMGYGILTPS